MCRPQNKKMLRQVIFVCLVVSLSLCQGAPRPDQFGWFSDPQSYQNDERISQDEQFDQDDDATANNYAAERPARQRQGYQIILITPRPKWTANAPPQPNYGGSYLPDLYTRPPPRG